MDTEKNNPSFEIIPAIDIIDGNCVRLTQGDYTRKKIYNEDPVEVALQFQDIGIRRLHLVDLDGAKKGAVTNYKTLEMIASKTKLIIDFGGGIKTGNDIEKVFNAGANIATIGSVAVANPVLFYSWIEKYGDKKILLGADVTEEKIAINGWQQRTSLLIYDFIHENMDKGVTTIFCTDIAKDGVLEGPSIELYKKIIHRFPLLQLIASGGVSNISDVYALKEIGCSAAIVGKAIYEARITLKELETLILN